MAGKRGGGKDRLDNGAAADAPGRFGTGAARARGRGGFRSAGDAARRHVVPVAERKGFAEADVLLRWTEILGADLATLCQPVKVSYGRGSSLGATLMVRAEGAVALEVEHLAPRILERINARYGYRAVARITITQGTGLAGTARGFAEDTEAFDGLRPSADGRARPAPNPDRGEARAPLPTTVEARSEAAALAHDIVNPALREALTAMGAFVLSRPTRPPDGGE